MWKIKLPKIVGNLLDKFRNFLYMKGRVILKFVAICPQAKQNSRQYLLLRTDISSGAYGGGGVPSADSKWRKKNSY